LSRQCTTQRRAAAASALEGLKTGDIIVVPAGRKAWPRGSCPRSVAPAGGCGTAPRTGGCSTVQRQVATLSACSTSRSPSSRSAGCAVPEDVQRQVAPGPAAILAATLRTKAGAGDGDKTARPRRDRERSAAVDDDEIARLRKALRNHPCHGCEDRENHARLGRAPQPAGARDRGMGSTSGSRAAPTRSRAPSTGSARCSPCWATLRRRAGDRGGQAAGPDLLRAGPAGGRLPARGAVGRADPGRALASAVSLLVYEARSTDAYGPRTRLDNKGKAREADREQQEAVGM